MKLKLPPVAKGSFVPYSIQKKLAKDKQNKKDQKKELKRNILINTGCVLLGFVLDKIPPFITWLISLLNQQQP